MIPVKDKQQAHLDTNEHHMIPTRSNCTNALREIKYTQRKQTRFPGAHVKKLNRGKFVISVESASSKPFLLIGKLNDIPIYLKFFLNVLNNYFIFVNL